MFDVKKLNALKETLDALTEDEKIIIKDYVNGHPTPTYSVGGLMVRRMIEEYEKTNKGE